MQQELITALGPNDLDDGDQGRRQKPCRCSSGATSDYRRNGRRRRSVHHGTLADHEVAVPAPSNWRVHLPVEAIGLL